MSVAAPELIRLLMDLRRGGVGDAAVLNAMERLDRAAFVPAEYMAQAHDNVALPIGFNQTISQPLIVALMTEALRLDKSHKVLEIGAGSGYMAAVLALLARRVFAVDIVPEFIATTQQRLNRLGIANISLKSGDGKVGWAVQAPFDRIVLSAAIDAVPPPLFEQLRGGGILVAPIGPVDGVQHITRYTKAASGVTAETLWPVEFVPLQ